MKSGSEADIVFLGDTYFGEWHMRLRARKGLPDVLAEKGYRHFGKPFEAMLQAADLTVMNLECAITDIEVSPLEGNGKTHIYAASKAETIGAMQQLGVDVAMVANNHAADFGKAGLVDTLVALEEAGIVCIGGGRTLESAETPFVFDKQVGSEQFRASIRSAYNRTGASERMGFYADELRPGVNGIDHERLSDALRSEAADNQGIYQIISPHWGPNYAWRTRGQQLSAHRMIRGAGADLIVGHSAHMIQEVEYIEGRLVAYSIGNFIMNGDGEYAARNLPPYSFIARLNVKEVAGSLERRLLLYPIVTANRETDFTPRYVSEEELDHVHAILKAHQFDPTALDGLVEPALDEFGPHLVCQLP